MAIFHRHIINFIFGLLFFANIVYADEDTSASVLVANATAVAPAATTLSNWQKIKDGVKGLFSDFYVNQIVKRYQKLEDFFCRTKQVRLWLR